MLRETLKSGAEQRKEREEAEKKVKSQKPKENEVEKDANKS